MDKIIKVLKRNNLDETNLPKSINVKIDDLERLIAKHNDEVDELDESENVTETQEAQIEYQSELIDAKEESIVDDILSFIEFTNKQKREKANIEQINARPKNNGNDFQRTNDKPKDEKKSGLGWLIFGTVVLVATAGVVNVMKNK